MTVWLGATKRRKQQPGVKEELTHKNLFSCTVQLYEAVCGSRGNCVNSDKCVVCTVGNLGGMVFD